MNVADIESNNGFKFQYDNTLSGINGITKTILDAFKFQYDNTLSLLFLFYLLA